MFFWLVHSYLYCLIHALDFISDNWNFSNIGITKAVANQSSTLIMKMIRLKIHSVQSVFPSFYSYRVKNMLDICGLLQEHYDKLQLTAEQVEKLRNDLRVRFALLSNDLKMQSENLKALTVEHENNMVNLKNTGKNAI